MWLPGVFPKAINFWRSITFFQTKSKNKNKDFQAFYLNQTLTDPLNGLLDVTPDPVLNMKFSQDGSYLATASKGGIIRIWQLSPDSYSMDEIFVTKPIREFTSHKAAVLGLSWSKVGHIDGLGRIGGLVHGYGYNRWINQIGTVCFSLLLPNRTTFCYLVLWTRRYAYGTWIGVSVCAYFNTTILLPA